MINSLNAEVEGLTIVLVGSFNPAIFQPAWLAAQKLIPEAEAEKAAINVITPDVAVFSIGWAALSIEKDKFIVESDQPAFYEAARDLIFGIFRVLRHTPVKYLGINCRSHFRVEKPEMLLTMGHLLAPKVYWNDVVKNPLLRSMRMLSERTDGHHGSVNVTIEPSLRITPGVFLQVNDHFEFPDNEPVTAATGVLNSVFQDSLARAEKIMQHLLTLRHEPEAG
jgi:hypothetical protein